MRFAPESGSRVPPALAVVLLLCFSVFPLGGKAHAPEVHTAEVGDLMVRMDADFAPLVKTVLIDSVQNLVSETPYETIRKRAETITATARILPNAERFQGDGTMLAFSRQIESTALELAKAAETKNVEAITRALFHLHAACVRCHQESRF